MPVPLLHLGLFSNRLIWAGIAAELFLIALVVYAPFMHGIFGTGAFPLRNWLLLLALSPLLLAADEIRKALLRWGERSTS